MKKIDFLRLKSLEALIYMNVQITTKDGKIFKGEISSYTRADDADDGLEDIGIRMPGYVECFDKTMIKSIEIEDSESIPTAYFKERINPSHTAISWESYVSGK